MTQQLQYYLSGVALTLRQFSSDGTEVLPPLDQDLSYDFNFQDIRRIGPRQIRPVCWYCIFISFILAHCELTDPICLALHTTSLMFCVYIL